MDGFDDGLLLDLGSSQPSAAGAAPTTPMSAEERAMKEQLSKIVMPSALRPDFALSAATGRPTEYVLGAELPTPGAEASFAVKVGQAGVTRVVALVAGPDDAAGQAAAATLYHDCGLQVMVVDLAAPGARAAALDLLSSAKADGARAVVCASPSGGVGGERATALVLASHCMAEYGTAPDEALYLLKARVAHSGVAGRVPTLRDLELFEELGCVDLSLAPLADLSDGVARPGVGVALNPDEVLFDLDDSNSPGGPTRSSSGLYL